MRPDALPRSTVRALGALALLSWPAGTARAQASAPAELLRAVAAEGLKRVAPPTTSAVAPASAFSVARGRAIVDAEGRALRVWAYQFDPGHRRPMAAVGTALSVFAPGTSSAPLPTRVLARIPVGPTTVEGQEACGEQTPALRQGWAYLLDGPAASLGFASDPEASVLALPAPTSLSMDTTAVTAARVALKPYLDRERADVFRAAVAKYRGVYGAASIRSAMYGHEGFDPMAHVPVHALRTPQGARFVATVDFGDDPSDHGQTTRRVMLFDARGRVLATADGRLNVYAIADVDADGTDELILQNAIVRIVGDRLDIPKQPAAESCT